MERSEMVRRGPGIVTSSEYGTIPDAVHHCVLHRIRETKRPNAA